MKRYALTLALPLAIAACGVADTATTAAAVAAGKAEEAKQAQAMKEQALRQVEAANQAVEQRNQEALRQAEGK